MRKKKVVVAVAVLLVVGSAGLALGLAVAGDDAVVVGDEDTLWLDPNTLLFDEDELVYDPVLGRTVPRVYQQALRDVEPSTLPETGVVAWDADIDPSRNPAEDAAIEDTSPVPPAIYRIPPEDAGNVPFSTMTMGATSVYSVSDGHVQRDVYAGAAGCAYGARGGSDCSPTGDRSYRRIGMIWELPFRLDYGNDPPAGEPIFLPGTGAITFRRIMGDTVQFSTESGRFGEYSLTTRTATLDR